MKGWEPGAKECPQTGKLIQIGGSISSVEKSAYFDVLEAASRVFVFEVLVLSAPVMLAWSCLLLK